MPSFLFFHFLLNPKVQVYGALMQRFINKSYVFKDGCDVEVNLQDFTRTEMKIAMKIKKALNVITYDLEVVDGKLISPKSNVVFKVEYGVNIYPMTGNPDEDSQKGTISIISVDGRVVNEKSLLEFKD